MLPKLRDPGTAVVLSAVERVLWAGRGGVLEFACAELPVLESKYVHPTLGLGGWAEECESSLLWSIIRHLAFVVQWLFWSGRRVDESGF